MFDRVAHDVMCDKVIVDDFEATYRTTKKLIKENRKQIAFISNISDLSVGKLRERGYKKAVLENPEQQTLILNLKKQDNPQKKIKAFMVKEFFLIQLFPITVRGKKRTNYQIYCYRPRVVLIIQ